MSRPIRWFASRIACRNEPVALVVRACQPRGTQSERDENALILRGPATAENFAIVLRGLTYDNRAASPNTSAERIVSLVASDLLHFGSAAVSHVTVRLLDSGPVRVEDDTFRTSENVTLEVTETSHAVLAGAVGFGVAGNDLTSPLDVDDPHHVFLVDGPYDRETRAASGRIELHSDGTFVFAPDTGYVGAVEFTYKVDDSFHVYGPATVTIHVDRFTPRPGDSNADRQFDQLDIVLVLQSARYLTGQPATFAEGDWNDDGLFDQLDIVAALQTGIYLRGPYA